MKFSDIAVKIWPGALGTRLMGWLKTGAGAIGRGIAALVASVFAFIASPTVWAAGVLFFVCGWVAAFSLGHVPKRADVDHSAVQRLEGRLATANGQVAALSAALAAAKGEVAAAEKRAAAAEEAAKVAPKVVYRSRPAAKPADAGVTLNWPKLQ